MIAIILYAFDRESKITYTVKISSDLKISVKSYSKKIKNWPKSGFMKK